MSDKQIPMTERDNDGVMGSGLVTKTPQQMTAHRKQIAQETGVEIAPWPAEITAYKKAGLTPPTK